MIALSLPATAVTEDLVLKQVCADPILAPHWEQWQKAYDNYRRKRGNEFGLMATKFPDAVGLAQKTIYKNRRSNPTLVAIRQTSVACCPRCGSPGTGHLDHHLPESEFVEFSILLANLVPTCGHCNSGAKQAKGKGAAWPERFLHPYYDRFARKALWRTVLLDPVAVAVEARPEPSLSPRLAKLVQYNLDNLLGWQFENFNANYWSSLPSIISRRAASSGLAGDNLVKVVLEDLSFSQIETAGLNGWGAAFLRGLTDNPAARVHLLAAAAAVPAPV